MFLSEGHRKSWKMTENGFLENTKTRNVWNVNNSFHIVLQVMDNKNLWKKS